MGNPTQDQNCYCTEGWVPTCSSSPGQGVRHVSFLQGLQQGDCLMKLHRLQPETGNIFLILNLPRAQTSSLAQCSIFPFEKCSKMNVYTSIYFLCSIPESQVKCDVDFNLLCIKYTKQTFAFPTLEIALSENCFAAEAQGLHLPGNWFIVSF